MSEQEKKENTLWELAQKNGMELEKHGDKYIITDCDTGNAIFGSSGGRKKCNATIEQVESYLHRREIKYPKPRVNARPRPKAKKKQPRKIEMSKKQKHEENNRLGFALAYTQKQGEDIYFSDLYLIYSPRHNLYKIGRSYNFKNRLRQIKHVVGDKRIKVICVNKINHPRKETQIHKKLISYNANSKLGKEWYLPKCEFIEEAKKVFNIIK